MDLAFKSEKSYKISGLIEQKTKLSRNVTCTGIGNIQEDNNSCLPLFKTYNGDTNQELSVKKQHVHVATETDNNDDTLSQLNLSCEGSKQKTETDRTDDNFENSKSLQEGINHQQEVNHVDVIVKSRLGKTRKAPKYPANCMDKQNSSKTNSLNKMEKEQIQTQTTDTNSSNACSIECNDLDSQARRSETPDKCSSSSSSSHIRDGDVKYIDSEYDVIKRMGHEKIYKITQLKNGDHIFFKRKIGYEHHAIVGDVRSAIKLYTLYHMNKVKRGVWSSTKTGANEQTKTFRKSDRMMRVTYGIPITDEIREKVVQRAKEQVKESSSLDPYNLISNNCEHFASGFYLDTPRSFQIENMGKMKRQLTNVWTWLEG